MRGNTSALTAVSQPLLRPLSLLYSFVSGLHRRSIVPRKLPRPVISVGNITWGGTGKTPVTIALAKATAQSGMRTVVLSRGYHRKSASGRPLIVSDGSSIMADAREAGDEPVLIAESASGCGVVVCSDRFAGGMAAMELLDPDLFILDDGFQHWKLERDLDIVCVNALDPFGNRRLIPAGKLREPLAALARADMVMITNSDAGLDGELRILEDEIRSFAPDIPVVRSACAVKGFRSLQNGNTFPPDFFSGRTAGAFSGLGDDRGFHKTLAACGIVTAGYVDFPDHYWYTEKDIVAVLKRFPDPCPVITTAKDAVRLKTIITCLNDRDAARLFALDIGVEVTGGQSWEYALQKMRQSSSTATAR